MKRILTGLAALVLAWAMTTGAQAAELAVEPQGQVAFISHGDCLEDAKAVEQMLKQRLGVKKVIISYVGPVIGAHTGPGVVALFFLGKER